MQYKEKIERKNIVQGVIVRNMPYKSQVNACDEPILETCSLIISILILIYILVQITLYFIIIIISLHKN